MESKIQTIKDTANIVQEKYKKSESQWAANSETKPNSLKEI